MPETKNYVFDHVEIAELMIKHLGVKEGIWGIYLEFGLGAANVPISPDGTIFTPAAITLINKIGLQRFDNPSNLTVDAALINPSKPASKKKQTSK